MVNEWSKRNIEQLIELYRERPCLWKLNHPNYTNKKIKNKMYGEIVEAFRDDLPQVDINTIKTKVQNMRSAYRKEVKKVEKSKRSSHSGLAVYTPGLWYFHLLDFTRSLPKKSNFDALQDREDAEDDSLEIREENVKEERSQNKESETEQEQVFRDPPRKQQKKGSKDLESSSSLPTCTTALNTPSQPSDDCAALGTYVSIKLRKMEEDQQILAEALIQKIITKGLKRQLTDFTDIHEID